MVGVEQIKKVLDLGIELANVLSVMKHGGSIFAFTRLMDEVSALGTLDFDAFKKEIMDISAEERLSLAAHVKAKLELQDKVVEAKIESGVDLVEDAVAVAESAVAFVNKVKVLFQV